jgi:hypothetical protein
MSHTFCLFLKACWAFLFLALQCSVLLPLAPPVRHERMNLSGTLMKWVYQSA